MIQKSQQIAPVSRCTFEVQTTQHRDLVNGELNAATIRSVFLDGFRELGRDAPDLIESLYLALRGEVELDPSQERYFQRALLSWKGRLVGEVAEQFEHGEIVLSFKAKQPTPRAGERSQAQLEALTWIDGYGLRHDEGDQLAFVDRYPNSAGIFYINVATVRALIKRGDIEKDGVPEYLGEKSEPDLDKDGSLVWTKDPIYEYQRWHLTDQGRRVMDLANGREQDGNARAHQ